MTDDERLIEEVADSVDPMLRWLAVWHADQYPVEVYGERRYLHLGSPALFQGNGLIMVQDSPNHTVGRVDANGMTVYPTVNITLVKVSDVKIPAPELIRERVSKILG